MRKQICQWIVLVTLLMLVASAVCIAARGGQGGGANNPGNRAGSTGTDLKDQTGYNISKRNQIISLVILTLYNSKNLNDNKGKNQGGICNAGTQ